MSTVTHCLECGTELNATEASGLCPKCMLKLGLASQLASGSLPATARGLTDDGTIVEPFDFGRYKVLRLLGKGGMGAVYEAEDRETQRRVALKVLGHTLDTAEMRARFLREGQIAASVSHPNIVGVFHAHEIEKTPVIAMELVHDGTLRDRVRRKGPLPVGEAVDLTLQIIEGLESAHRAGVLHRDVKPANCFVTPEGTVKVGDFGLSISTLVRAESELTARGTILGTPAFAAPEQLRGREVDVRADIYAVGATLYYLLTGRQTHTADTLVSLIAAVLEQAPRDPREFRPDLPKGLSRFLMRCLAKEPERRPQSYEELRSALLAFSSVAPTSAVLGLRILAGILDVMIAGIPAAIFMGTTGRLPEENVILSQTSQAALIMGGFWILQVAYYAIPETLWGASLGKALCGLRIVGANPEADLQWWRTTLRAVVFCLPLILEVLLAVFVYLPPIYEQRLAEMGISRTVLAPGLSFLLLFVTMRRRNGFAALHDLITGTRVVAWASEQRRPGIEVEHSTSPVLGADLIGPYAVVRRRSGLIDAWDEMLRRAVWIRPGRPGEERPVLPRHQISRATRLRWLTGEHTDSVAWDAYEALEGVPLTALMDGQQPWSKVRFWLLDLAEEIHIALSEGTLTGELGVQNVWITRDGRAVLLDFPAPDATPGATMTIRSARDASAFLSMIAEKTCAPRMPLHAREFIAHLRNERLEDTSIIAANLRSLVTRPAHFSRRRRLFTLAIPILVALPIALAVGPFVTETEQGFDKMWVKEYPGRPSLRLVLDAYTYNTDETQTRKQRLISYVATNYRYVIADPKFWERDETVEAIDPTSRTLATAAVVNKERFAAPDVPLNDAEIASTLRRQEQFESRMWLIVVPASFLLQVAIYLVLGSLWTFFGHAPFALHMAGAALVRADGRPVSRLRGLLRSLPVLLAALGTSVWFLVSLFDFSGAFIVGSLLLSTVALLVAAVIGAMKPDHGLPDMIAGTYIVPR